MSNSDASQNGTLPVARQLLASALEMEPSELPDDAAIGQVANWDSLAHMRLIMGLEEHMAAPLPPEAVVSIGSLADIVTVLEEVITPTR